MALKFEPTKEFYLKNEGKTLRVGRTPKAEIMIVSTQGQSGSWERGFKFHNSKWACLKRVRITARRKHGVSKATEYSMDHGKTWFWSIQLARKSKGKLKLSTDTRKEFAFDSIQRINREYDPYYSWRK
jgi:hypothetical protein